MLIPTGIMIAINHLFFLILRLLVIEFGRQDLLVLTAQPEYTYKITTVPVHLTVAAH